jgi:hypothetical protein
LRDAVPKASQEAKERLQCGDVIGALDALYVVWSAFDHLCSIAEFYMENICEQEGEPFEDIAYYEPAPQERWICLGDLLDCFNQPIVTKDQLQEFLERYDPIEIAQRIRERAPDIPTFNEVIKMRIDHHERIFNEAMRLMDEAKTQHYECTIEQTEECWTRYRATLGAVKILALTERYRVGKLDTPFKRRERPPPSPPPAVGGTINSIILLLIACTRERRITGIPPQRITRAVTSAVIAEALKTTRREIVEAQIQVAKTLCTPPNQMAGGQCTQFTIPRINRRARTLERMLQRNIITPERFRQFMEELGEKCRELGGRWDGSRCR